MVLGVVECCRLAVLSALPGARLAALPGAVVVALAAAWRGALLGALAGTAVPDSLPGLASALLGFLIGAVPDVLPAGMLLDSRAAQCSVAPGFATAFVGLQARAAGSRRSGPWRSSHCSMFGPCELLAVLLLSPVCALAHTAGSKEPTGEGRLASGDFGVECRRERGSAPANIPPPPLLRPVLGVARTDDEEETEDMASGDAGSWSGMALGTVGISSCAASSMPDRTCASFCPVAAVCCMFMLAGLCSSSLMVSSAPEEDSMTGTSGTVRKSGAREARRFFTSGKRFGMPERRPREIDTGHEFSRSCFPVGSRECSGSVSKKNGLPAGSSPATIKR